jgi:hypothetical protein
MISGPLVNGSSQTSIFICCFITWPINLLQPSTLLAFFNFIPRRQLHPSSPSTSSLVANFNPPRLQLQPSPPLNFQTQLLFYFLPFSLMSTVCLMLLLPDELVTKIIIHSIKDEPVGEFRKTHHPRNVEV